MAVRHSANRMPHPTVLPADELPKPLAAPLAVPSGPLALREDGTIADKATAKVYQRRARRARDRRVRLVGALGLTKIAEDASFKPYRDAAKEFLDTHLESLGRLTGPPLRVCSHCLKPGHGLKDCPRASAKKKSASDGSDLDEYDEAPLVGPGPSSMVASAGLQLAASRWAFDRGAATNDATLFKQGSAFANDSRQNLLAAYELATREAAARPRSPRDIQAEWRRRILGEAPDDTTDAPTPSGDAKP